MPHSSLQPANEVDDVIKCEKCQIEIIRNEYRYHLRTNLHKSNCLIRTEFNDIDIVATAFKNRIVTYRLNAAQNLKQLPIEVNLSDKRKHVIQLLKMSLCKHECIKVNFELFAYFILPKSDEQQLKSFNTKYEIIYQSTELNEMVSNLFDTFTTKLSEFEHCESGWTYESMSHIEINVNKYCPLRGGTYIDLPNSIKLTKSCINIQNHDDYCFLWCVVANLFPAKNNVCKVRSYPHYSSVLNIKGISFPPTYKDIELFEMKNPNISINIYGMNNKGCVNGPLYCTKDRKSNHINLLFIERGNKGHYCLIKNLLRLIRRQVSKHKGKIFLCERCLQCFKSEAKYLSHNCNSILTILPKEHSILKFENYQRQQKINFIIYADFECLLLDSQSKSSKNTKTLQLHKPSCFGYYICCSHDPSLNKYVSYRGENCVEIFVKSLIKDVQRVHGILQDKKPMFPLTIDQESQYQNATRCYICKQVLLGDKVRDHDHITSEFRGAAHSHCNLMHRVCPFIPIVFHNLSGYDSHLFIEELSKYEGDFRIIPKTKEKYLSITKVIKFNKFRKIEMKFIDSFQFLSSSLDLLSKSLYESDFVHLRNCFDDKKQFDLMRRKGVYPYDYMDSWSKYYETQLPTKSCFYNCLKEEHISDHDFKHALDVWKHFDVNNLGEYTDLYLKTDVLILCDIFEKFRITSLRYYKLDPAYYITLPSLSWDAMLFHTNVKLELISDIDIYHMLERGIRGGLAQCSVRHAEASNKYLPNYDKSKQSSFLVYLDCNNLYGYAMTKKYPISEFRFLTTREIKYFNVMNITDDNDYGYILEVDLLYPDHLHKSHEDLPFAPEKFIPPGSKTEKLIASLYDKYNYVIHYVHLKECLKHGLILTKIHQIIGFRQDSFLKEYIDLNTALRQSSKTPFEKDFFKLLNNSIFGKTIENKRKQVDVKLVTRWRETKNVTNKHLTAEKLIAKPNLKSIDIFSENFAAIQLTRDELVLDRPIYIGFSVLEYAKQHMYQFHYDFIKRKYNDYAQLCYTDTDSLLYLIYTNDFYEDLRNDLSQFDTSNYASNNGYNIPQINDKIPGIFKDEMAGDVISEFTGLRAKLYCIKTVKSIIKKAKGITKAATRNLSISDYNNTLLNKTTTRCNMKLIRAVKHVLYTQQVNKKLLNGNDDKRQIQEDCIHTLPWGHCDMIF